MHARTTTVAHHNNYSSVDTEGSGPYNQVKLRYADQRRPTFHDREVPLLYILLGPDDYSLHSRLKSLKKEWDDPSALDVNTTVFDGRKLTLSELMNACNTLPFLGQKRLVIVEGLLGRFNAKGAKRQSEGEEWQSLATYIEQMPPSTVLVLVDIEAGATNAIFRKLSPKAAVQTFPLLKGARLREWIRARVAGQGGKITPRAADLLAEFCGENLWSLANEIDKLLVHAAGATVQEQDVRQLTSYVREANVFAMVDAVLERRGDAALRLIHQLLSQGEAVPYIMTMIARQLRLVLRAKDLAASGTVSSEIAGRLGLSPNFPIDKLLKQGRSYSPDRLLQAFRKLLETDVAIKTGRQRDELALDLLVADLCSQDR